jgi:hypothetical protein
MTLIQYDASIQAHIAAGIACIEHMISLAHSAREQMTIKWRECCSKKDFVAAESFAAEIEQYIRLVEILADELYCAKSLDLGLACIAANIFVQIPVKNRSIQ